MPSYIDGKLRVLSPGKEYNRFHEVGTREHNPLPIPANFYKPRWETNKGPRIRHNQWRYVDYNQDSKTDLVVAVEDWSEYGWDDAWDSNGQWQRGPLHGFIFIFENEGTNEVPAYKDPIQLMSDGKELDVYGCPSPNFGDFDGDGDLDLICGEFIDGFTYFENQGTPSNPKYAAGKTLETFDGLPLKMELQMIVPVAFDWDRDGDLDLIVGDEDGRVAFIENVGVSSPGQPPLPLGVTGGGGAGLQPRHAGARARTALPGPAGAGRAVKLRGAERDSRAGLQRHAHCFRSRLQLRVMAAALGLARPRPHHEGQR
jgi:hypothetical protein